MESGIYKFTNTINGKAYIGQSQNIVSRFRSHKSNHFNENLKDYQTKFYRALRKYGFENFSFEILERISLEKLDEREKYWISFYDSYRSGYNSNRGGENVSERNQEHPMAKLDNKSCLEIKRLLKSTDRTQREISKEFSISQAIVSDINNGFLWNTIGDYTYPIRCSEKRLCSSGERHFASVLTLDDVIKIREEYVYKTGREIYENYSHLCSYSTLERVLLGKTYSEVPYYSKKKKEWILK